MYSAQSIIVLQVQKFTFMYLLTNKTELKKVKLFDAFLITKERFLFYPGIKVLTLVYICQKCH